MQLESLRKKRIWWVNCYSSILNYICKLVIPNIVIPIGNFEKKNSQENFLYHEKSHLEYFETYEPSRLGRFACCFKGYCGVLAFRMFTGISAAAKEQK